MAYWDTNGAHGIPAALRQPPHGSAGRRAVADLLFRHTPVTVGVRKGRRYYGLSRDGRTLILPSLLGFEFREAPPLRDGLRITDTARQSHDDGVGFRYRFPEQPGLGAFEITDELTEFSFADNPRAWCIPSDQPRMDRSERRTSWTTHG